MRILIAEDEPTTRAILAATLKKRGHQVVMAEEGRSALDVLSRPDAPLFAVLDWIMPEMDGLQVVRKVRTLDRPIPPYIIILTSRSEKRDVVAALKAGADDMLTKPCDADELLARVDVGRRMLEIQETLIKQKEELRCTHAQLAHAQKLEAVGQLAAGIAHEINTPAQFIGDSIHFLKEAFEDQRAIIARYRQAVDVLAGLEGHEALLGAVREAEEEADIEYLQEHIPKSLERSVEGLSRISSIVGAMKEFAHPDQREKSPADINQALRSTLTVARNEYKYVADVVTELGDLPPVACHLGDLNQVFLNLLVNAAHAIGDVVGGSGEKGTIRVRTSSEGESVRIEIADTGTGIPVEFKDRIYDPFFTTKEVGQGSGQGLAIARTIVVDNHGGTLSCETVPGEGTSFIIALPTESGEAIETEACQDEAHSLR